MLKAGSRDIVAGLLVAAFGAATAIYSYGHYRMGTLPRMGPGMFPVALGVGMTLIGIGIALTSLTKREVTEPIEYHLRGVFFVIVSLIVFGLVVPLFGLVPAVMALVVIAALGVKQLTLLQTLILAAGTAAGIALVFVVGLQLQIDLVRWPL